MKAYRAGEFAQAERIFLDAIKMEDSIPLAFRQVISRTYHSLGFISLVRRDHQEALDRFVKAMEVKKAADQAFRELVSLPEVSKGNYGVERRADNDEHFKQLAATAFVVSGMKPARSAELKALAFEAIQRGWKSEVSHTISQMSMRPPRNNPRAADLVRERQLLLRQIKELNRTAKNHSAIPGILKQTQPLEAELRNAFPEQSLFLVDVPLTIERVQQLLKPEEALIVYARLPDERWMIFALTIDAVDWAIANISAPQIAALIGTLRCGLDHTAWVEGGPDNCKDKFGAPKPNASLPFDAAAAYTLYSALFAPIEARVRGKHVFIAAEPAMMQLPFAALVVEPPRERVAASDAQLTKLKWLGVRQPMSFLASILSLQQLRVGASQSSAQKPFIGFGNPLLTGAPSHLHLAELAQSRQSCSAIPGNGSNVKNRAVKTRAPLIRGNLVDVEDLRRQTPLPETADELCSVSRTLGAGEDSVRLGQRATEKIIKALSRDGVLERHRIVHFATHGVLAGELDSALEPGLILSPPAEASSEDDGYLSASEIATLKLDADLVVLSACNTAGAGGGSTEALTGLAESFFFAGARAVLVSHWAVDSMATVELITRSFLEQRATKTIGQAEGMRRAMAGLIASGRAGTAHPSVWAPFALIGDGSAQSASLGDVSAKVPGSPLNAPDAWLAVKDSVELSELMDFFERFPGTGFARQAMQRIRDLAMVGQLRFPRSAADSSTARVAVVINGEFIAEAAIKQRALLNQLVLGTPYKAPSLIEAAPDSALYKAALDMVIDEVVKKQEIRRVALVGNELEPHAAFHTFCKDNRQIAELFFATLIKARVDPKYVVDLVQAENAWRTLVGIKFGLLKDPVDESEKRTVEKRYLRELRESASIQYR